MQHRRWTALTLTAALMVSACTVTISKCLTRGHYCVRSYNCVCAIMPAVCHENMCPACRRSPVHPSEGYAHNAVMQEDDTVDGWKCSCICKSLEKQALSIAQKSIEIEHNFDIASPTILWHYLQSLPYPTSLEAPIQPRYYPAPYRVRSPPMV